ncbi:uncharacterized protein THITE_2128193 [Thermothielavioides terrestris NRRL 8126]|uniref:IBR domain-containing protein n=1 Tax=Thermothielavioides terrestris (strain ATCC 38088 / NRRL 8126) TaxID=578455 RepID=G2R4P2_THETT|nr:uncharacterized protein THITE_2128193 [Thermothielavioides terrestris NRRL 8126]AEO66082.1 hypothetical protein THITE_2128193 [Thermothielavioides terrestris NRRL 8126]
MAGDRATCIICFDDFDEGVRDVCHNGHSWCSSCLLASVQTAIQNISDSSCMPPRCCGDGVLPTDDDDVGDHPEQHRLDAERRARDLSEARTAYVDRSLVRMAQRYKGANLFQFCQRCYRLVTKRGGCNHMKCVCGYEFCIICGSKWGGSSDQQTGLAALCHPFFGSEDKHVLCIPPEVKARLDAEEQKPPPALADECATGTLCIHSPSLHYLLRLRRELSSEELERARCDVCGHMFKSFLLQCRGCATLMCLDCRDSLCNGRIKGVKGVKDVKDVQDVKDVTN